MQRWQGGGSGWADGGARADTSARGGRLGRASPINLPRGGGCKIQKEDRRLYLTTPRNTLPAQQRASFALCAMSVRRRCAWSRPGQRCGAKPAWSRRPAGLGSRRPCRSDHEHTAHDRPRERLEPKRSAVLRSPAAATAGAARVVLSTSWRPVERPVRPAWCRSAHAGTCDGRGAAGRLSTAVLEGLGRPKGRVICARAQGKAWLPNARRAGASRGSAAWYQLGGHFLHRERAVRRPVGTLSGASLFERFCSPTASREPQSAILLNGIRASGQDRWVARVSRQTVHLKRRNTCRSLQPARA